MGNSHVEAPLCRSTKNHVGKLWHVCIRTTFLRRRTICREVIFHVYKHVSVCIQTKMCLYTKHRLWLYTNNNRSYTNNKQFVYEQCTSLYTNNRSCTYTSFDSRIRAIVEKRIFTYTNINSFVYVHEFVRIRTLLSVYKQFFVCIRSYFCSYTNKKPRIQPTFCSYTNT